MRARRARRFAAFSCRRIFIHLTLFALLLTIFIFYLFCNGSAVFTGSQGCRGSLPNIPFYLAGAFFERYIFPEKFWRLGFGLALGLGGVSIRQRWLLEYRYRLREMAHVPARCGEHTDVMNDVNNSNEFPRLLSSPTSQGILSIGALYCGGTLCLVVLSDL